MHNISKKQTVKASKKSSESQYMRIRIPAAAKHWLKAKAKEHRCSMNTLMVRALEIEMENDPLQVYVTHYKVFGDEGYVDEGHGVSLDGVDDFFDSKDLLPAMKVAIAKAKELLLPQGSIVMHEQTYDYAKLAA